MWVSRICNTQGKILKAITQIHDIGKGIHIEWLNCTGQIDHTTRVTPEHKNKSHEEYICDTYGPDGIYSSCKTLHSHPAEHNPHNSAGHEDHSSYPEKPERSVELPLLQTPPPAPSIANSPLCSSGELMWTSWGDTVANLGCSSGKTSSAHDLNERLDEEEVEIREGIGEPLVAPLDDPTSPWGWGIPSCLLEDWSRKGSAKVARSPLQMLEKEASMLIPAWSWRWWVIRCFKAASWTTVTFFKLLTWVVNPSINSFWEEMVVRVS